MNTPTTLEIVNDLRSIMDSIPVGTSPHHLLAALRQYAENVDSLIAQSEQSQTVGVQLVTDEEIRSTIETLHSGEVLDEDFALSLVEYRAIEQLVIQKSSTASNIMFTTSVRALIEDTIEYVDTVVATASPAEFGPEYLERLYRLLALNGGTVEYGIGIRDRLALLWKMINDSEPTT